MRYIIQTVQKSINAACLSGGRPERNSLNICPSSSTTPISAKAPAAPAAPAAADDKIEVKPAAKRTAKADIDIMVEDDEA